MDANISIEVTHHETDRIPFQAAPMAGRIDRFAAGGDQLFAGAAMFKIFCNRPNCDKQMISGA